MVANGWQLGTPAGYNRELALCEEDLLGFAKDTQEALWQKYCKLYPQVSRLHLLESVASQLDKAVGGAASSTYSNREMRTFGTLGLVRNDLRDRGARFKQSQFNPKHDLDSDMLERILNNKLRIVSELVCSPRL